MSPITSHRSSGTPGPAGRRGRQGAAFDEAGHAGVVKIQKSGPLLPPSWRLVRRSLDELRPPEGARPEGESGLDELAKNLSTYGPFEPLLIEPGGVIIDGVRRQEALKRLGHKQADCVILPPGADPCLARLFVHAHRRGLSRLEKARSYKAILGHTGWSQQRLAREIGVPRSKISLALNLLDAPREVQELVESGKASPYDAMTAFGQKGWRDGRAERFIKRVRSGRPVHARVGSSSKKIPRRLLPEGMKVTISMNKVVLAFEIPDETEDLSRLADIRSFVSEKLDASLPGLLGALKEARRSFYWRQGRV